ncbi:MAG TPA: glycosyltransferase [Solirubrobacteraceae bacterium]|jgi:GT2 family glycosyltransferase|nr:glycosyltransferase [Solirubrobacteraceae bacterium]
MAVRPPASVIVPFAGSESELEVLLSALMQLRLADGDELIVADNRPDDPDAERHGTEHGPISVIPAGGISSPGFARNRAAAAARCEWLVMIDADTEPSPTLLDAYFTPPPAPATAILAGGIIDRAATAGLAGRHSAGRAQMDQVTTLRRGSWSYAQSANCAVRRAPFVALGGFDELARAGEDADLCFRLRAEGWAIEPRPAASVIHRSRATIPALLAQLARHGAGAAWLQARYPGSFPPPTRLRFLARLARSARAAALAGAGGDGDGAYRAALEIGEACAFEGGRLLSNRARISRIA